MGFDLDSIIDQAAASSRSRFPSKGDPMDAALERAFKRNTRDRDAADARARKQAGPMRYLDDSQTSGVILPSRVRKP